ncbi:hypothetical protein ACPOM7_17255 [Peribacillus castrilensis]|uniref:hypothetical protein n=1 Tax=Bacillaceae TaxID=186817 RepID=UPI000660F9BB|nr:MULTISPECIES: hypothetical protein [Bacillaceae]MCT1391910.1 hypothetical protein [Peribacillus frigoritolerans]NCT39952.1 hypothetical protein [Peribacillus frigoritolerans]PRA79600.1 hypothetical protein CQ056_22415 [Peribacillus simplex]
MFQEIMSYGNFLFWYSFIIVWFFLAAAAIYFVVVKDGLSAIRSRVENKVFAEDLTKTELVKSNIK